MAEVTGLRNNGLPYPVYAAPYGIVAPILDADGDLVTGAAGLDSEVSLNGDTFADCTNEATEIATSSGVYYLLLTAAEMTADVVTVIIKTSTSGAKTTTIVLYPRKLVELASGTSQGGAAGYITLAAGAVAFDGQYNGCLCVATIDTLVEARILQACTASNQQCTVTPSWNVTPDDNDTYKIYLPEGRQIPTANITQWLGVAPLALSSQQVQAVVPTTQKVDVETIKTKAVTVDAGGTTFPSGTISNTTNITAAAGVALASTGLDAVAVTDPTGAADAASTLGKMLRWLFLRFWSKNTMTADTLTTYKSDGATSMTTQALTDDTTTQTQGKAS